MQHHLHYEYTLTLIILALHTMPCESIKAETHALFHIYYLLQHAQIQKNPAIQHSRMWKSSIASDEETHDN